MEKPDSWGTKMSDMSIAEIIDQVTLICKKNHLEHLSLFGSYARGTETARSDTGAFVKAWKI